MKHDLREASLSDRAEALQLLRSAFAPYVAKLGRVVEADSFDWLEQALADGQVNAAIEDNGIQGVLVAEPRGNLLYVKVVAARPDQQGKGLGSRLLESIEASARAEGCQALLLDTAAIMDDLRRLYERFGFVEYRRAPPDHGKDAILRVYMRKEL